MTRAGKDRLWQYWFALLVCLSVYYLYRALNYRFITPDQLGPTLFNKQIWYVSHLLVALPVLIGGPLQFSRRLRQARPALHRLMGRAYVFSAVLAGLTAIYLGAVIDDEFEGSRMPIVLLGILWVFFSIAAWRCAVRRDFAAHRLFMIRSYGLALVFVWLRLLGDVPPDLLFFYIEDPAMRDSTLEWMSWVLPLLAIEFWISWLPLLRGRKA